MTNQVIIYSKDHCPFCVQAKAFFDGKGVAYTEIDVAQNEEEREKMIALTGGRITVPQIFIGETHVGGYDDLTKLNASGKVDELLEKIED